MSPGDKNIKGEINTASKWRTKGQKQIVFALLALSLSACANNSTDNKQADAQFNSGHASLSSMRPKADQAVVERIREAERLQAEKQAQAAIYAETAGAQPNQTGLGRSLPKVSTDPFSAFSNSVTSLIAPPAESVSANGEIMASNNNQASAGRATRQSPGLATYESAYSSVPPPPPGALGGGLVPPPPAVTLSTQAQAYAGAIADSAAAFYNNPYFNPFGVPAPPQGAAPGKRPAGLFGGGPHEQSNYNADNAAQKHKADFVPITPKGMESRSPYKQRDDFRALWKGALKASVNLGDLAENQNLIEQLGRQDIGLPTESTKGSFNVSARQVEAVFKAAQIDKRALVPVRKLQTELVQSYYRYLSAYNKYALLEQTVAARKQEVELSDSDSEKQRAAADLAQSQNDLDACKEDLHSSEIELAAASSPASARSVISRVAGIAPSVDSLAQGVSQSASHNDNNHSRRIVGFFDNVFKHPHANTAQTSDSSDLPENKAKPSNDSHIAKKKEADKLASKGKDKAGSLFGKFIAHGNSDKDSAKSISSGKSNNKDKADSASSDDDLGPTPVAKNTSRELSTAAIKDASEEIKPSSSTNSGASNIAFVLKNVTINPRKSVLTVSVKNAGNEPFELNTDTIYIAEGSRKLSSAALRADFDNTSIEPNHEVKGTITVFSRPWNDKLVIYLVDGSKTIQLKR